MCERGGETDREENQSHLDAGEVLACSPFFLTDQKALRERELNNMLCCRITCAANTDI